MQSSSLRDWDYWESKMEDIQFSKAFSAYTWTCNNFKVLISTSQKFFRVGNRLQGSKTTHGVCSVRGYRGLSMFSKTLKAFHVILELTVHCVEKAHLSQTCSSFIYLFIFFLHEWWTMKKTVISKCLLSPLSPYRFCTGDRTGDLLQNWTLHTTVLFLLPGHSSLPDGHNGCSHANLEHFTSPWWLPCTSSYNHQSFIGISLPSTSRQRLCGVAMLSLRKPIQREAAVDTDSSHNNLHLINQNHVTPWRRAHSWCTVQLNITAII